MGVKCKHYKLQCMLCSIKIGVFFTILGYETLFRTSLWHTTKKGSVYPHTLMYFQIYNDCKSMWSRKQARLVVREPPCDFVLCVWWCAFALAYLKRQALPHTLYIVWKYKESTSQSFLKSPLVQAVKSLFFNKRLFHTYVTHKDS